MLLFLVWLSVLDLHGLSLWKCLIFPIHLELIRGMCWATFVFRKVFVAYLSYHQTNEFEIYSLAIYSFGQSLNIFFEHTCMPVMAKVLGTQT